MPPAFVAILPALITAAATATTVGVELSNQPSATPPSKAPVPLTGQENQAQKASVASTLPTLQSLTGGSLSPEYAAQWGANNTGLQNNPQASQNIQSAINQYFGLGAPGQTGLTPSSSGGGNAITDLLSNYLRPQGGTPTPPTGGGNVIDGLLNQSFTGFSQ